MSEVITQESLKAARRKPERRIRLIRRPLEPSEDHTDVSEQRILSIKSSVAEELFLRTKKEIAELHLKAKRDENILRLKAKVQSLEETNEKAAQERVAYELKVAELLDVISDYETEVEQFGQQIAKESQLESELFTLRSELLAHSKAIPLHQNCCHEEFLNTERKKTAAMEERLAELTEQLSLEAVAAAEAQDKMRELYNSEIRALQGLLIAGESKFEVMLQKHQEDTTVLREDLAKEYDTMRQRAVDLATSSLIAEQEVRMQTVVAQHKEALFIAEEKYNEKKIQVERLATDLDSLKDEFNREISYREKEKIALTKSRDELQSKLLEVTQQSESQKIVVHELNRSLSQQKKHVEEDRIKNENLLVDQRNSYELKLKRQQKRIQQLEAELSDKAQVYANKVKDLKVYQEYLMTQVQRLSERDKDREVQMASVVSERDRFAIENSKQAFFVEKCSDLERSLSSLSSRIEILSAENASLKETEISLMAMLAVKGREIEDLTRASAESVSAAEKANSSRLELSDSLSRAELDLTLLQASLASRDEEIENLRISLQSTQDELVRVLEDHGWAKHHSNEQVSTLQCLVATQSRERLDLDKSLRSLQKTLESKNDYALSLEQSIELLMSEKIDLQNSLEEVKSCLEAIQMPLDSMKEEAEALRNQIAVLEREKLLYMNSEAQLCSAVKRKVSENKALQESARKVKESLSACTEQLNQIKQQLSFTSDEVNIKSKELESLEDEKLRMSAEIDRLESSKFVQDAALNALEVLIEKLQADGSDYRILSELKDIESKATFTGCTTQLAGMRVEISSLQEMVKQLEAENSNNVTAISNLQNQLDSSEASREWLNRQYVSKSLEAMDLEETIEQLRVSLHANCEHLTDLREQLEAKNIELEEKQAIISSLENEKTAWRAENASLHATILSHDSVVREMVVFLEAFNRFALPQSGESSTRDEVVLQREEAIRSFEKQLDILKERCASFVSSVQQKEQRVQGLFQDLRSSCGEDGSDCISYVGVSLAEALEEERSQSLQSIGELEATVQSHENTVLLLQSELDLLRRRSDGNSSNVSFMVQELSMLQQNKLLMEARLQNLEDEKMVLVQNLEETKQRNSHFSSKIEQMSSELRDASLHSRCNDIDALRKKRIEELKKDMGRLEAIRISQEATVEELTMKLSKLESDNAILRRLDAEKEGRISDLMTRLHSVSVSDHTASSRAVLGLSTPVVTPSSTTMNPSKSKVKTSTQARRTPIKKATTPITPLSVPTRQSGSKTTGSRALKDITNVTPTTMITPRAGSAISFVKCSTSLPTNSGSCSTTPLPGSTPVRRQALFIDAFLNSHSTSGDVTDVFFH